MYGENAAATSDHALFDQDSDVEEVPADEPGTNRGTRQRDLPDATPRFTDSDALTGDAYPDAGAPTTFDPSDHNVEDVLAYIEQYPEQRDAILTAERAGRARKGIVGDD